MIGWRIRPERFVHYVGPGVSNAVYLRGFYRREQERALSMARAAEKSKQRARRLKLPR